MTSNDVHVQDGGADPGDPGRRRGRFSIDWIAIVVSALALATSFWATSQTHNDAKVSRQIEDQRRLHQIIAEIPTVIADSDTGASGMLRATFQVQEAKELAERLGSRVVPAQKVGLGYALMAVDDFSSADVILASAASSGIQKKNATVVITALRLRAHVAGALEKPEESRRYVKKARKAATVKNLGSKLVVADVNILTESAGFETELLFNHSCDHAWDHYERYVRIIQDYALLAELPLVASPEEMKTAFDSRCPAVGSTATETSVSD